ncbi:MAG: class I SAM-dependent RNA methyltransferase [Chloroflexi bacterium]|nr:class I SAM-dependent RNA methyltransferase [Chloroflexota bacterium]MCO6442756.1 class I SAM-dependent RNA methyltransferase [Anaerolineae bacterium]MDL1916019.1 class I SAM-dependent RNA methyltransferase [Anaerolineae bacterium CFX4]MEB2365226.1 TRAM domain-containing protein [Chloroflexota bacterium]GIK29654.1 MAG: putative RNA methyltransferase [Chloroflexota bacterium]
MTQHPSHDTITIELAAMANGGRALGRVDGQVVFVPYTIPGERVEARIVESRGRALFAEGITLLEASADRVYPECPHFGPGRCGRCQWQHIHYDAQLLLKQDVLADQLMRIGGLDETILERTLKPIIRSPSAWQYANSLSFTITPDGLALPSLDNDRQVVIETCLILHPDLQDVLSKVQFEPDAKVERVRLMRGTEGAPMMVLSVIDEADAPELELDFTASVNLILPDLTPVNLIGDLHVTVMVNGRPYRVTAGSAIRANYDQIGALIGAAEAGLALQGGESVLDLYAGVGLFAASAAMLGAQVTAVESYPSAAADAVENTADLPVTVIHDTVENALQSSTASTPDAVIVDPPSDGLSLAAMDALGQQVRPRRIVYVSSDAATLGRDIKRLVRHGYSVENIQPIDLSPQTYYLDSVVTLTRA